MIDWLKAATKGDPVDPPTPEIELNGTSVPVRLRRHPTAKRMTLRLAPDGGSVKVTLPRWGDSREALAFVHSRTDWLAAQRARIPSRTAPQAGGTLMFRGRNVTINWDAKAPRAPALTERSLRVGGSAEGLETRLRRWLEKEALALFEGDLAYYLHAADLAAVPIGLSRAQKRWGSCSDGGASDQRRIRINWRLVQAPDFVRRSVVAHEVAHLVHFDHSPAFHALLSDIFESNIRDADQWLKVNGRQLYAAFG